MICHGAFEVCGQRPQRAAQKIALSQDAIALSP
jgi:hypothetical protein